MGIAGLTRTQAIVIAGIGTAATGLMGASHFSSVRRGDSPLPGIVGGAAAIGMAAIFSHATAPALAANNLLLLASIGGLGLGAIAGSVLGAATLNASR